MNTIRIGKLLPGARRFSDQNINETYLGHLVMEDQSRVQAFVKIVGYQELFIECCCAAIGRELDIKIPEPFIVILEEECGLLSPGVDILIGFGTENATFPSLRQKISDCDWAIQRLIKSKTGVDISIFDEWINNPDRHIGNILFDGTDKFVFIDHGLAQIAKNDVHLPSVRNVILDLIAKTYDDISKYKITRNLPDTIAAYSSINLNDLPAVTHGKNYLPSSDTQAIVAYLASRISFLQEIIREKIQFSQTGLAL